MPDRPHSFGNYEVLDLAGKGAMGLVYVGRDPSSGGKVAIKTCEPQGHMSESERKVVEKLFLNEAHSAGNLRHPNVIEIYDTGEEHGRLYIVMEYVDGGETLEPYVSPTT